jgi:glutamate synthase (NADPH/NADH) large chain
LTSSSSLKDRIEEIREETETAVREGSTTLILSDKNISNQKASIPSILTVGAVHSHLVKQGLRGYCSLNVECSDALGYPFIRCSNRCRCNDCESLFSN